MKIRYLVIAALAALLLGGCATYGYRGGSGDYYYGRSSGHYGAPYGSVGYGTYGGFYGSVGYGYPGYYYGRSYWPRSRYYGFGYRQPYYGGYYYPPYYYGRPVVRPRPGNDRPRDDRPNAPWRNLQGVTRVEHRERPERVHTSPAGIRTQGRAERIQPSIRPQAQQRSRTSPWRAAPAPQRQSSPPQRQRATPAPSRRATPAAESRDSDRSRIQER